MSSEGPDASYSHNRLNKHSNLCKCSGNLCKGADPDESRALIAVPLKPNVMVADKAHSKVQRDQTPVKCKTEDSIILEGLFFAVSLITHNSNPLFFFLATVKLL